MKDNLFQSVSLSGGSNLVNSFNGYSTNTTKLPSSTGGDKTVTNFDYQTSFLGSYYYPTNGTNLAQLLNAGSRTASSAGLTNYTTTTNQVADSGPVDIGCHFFTVNTNTIVTIQATTPIATESGQQGLFTVFRTGPTNSELTVYYKVGGTAIPGTDYSALSNSVTIDTGSPSQNITVTPIDNNTITFDKTVTASLILTNNYFVGTPSQATVTVQDTDPLSTNVIVAVANLPAGIDYHPVQNSLIVSVNNDTAGGNPNNFQLIASGINSNWTFLSGIGFSQGEIKLGIVQITTNNWTQGDMYFGAAQPGKIGKITANGSSVNTNWATLTNASQMVGETSVFIGGLYIDQTGVFGGDMIVAIGATASNPTDGGRVWRIQAGTTNATRVAQITDSNGDGTSLEGVVTVPNDSAKYGPWAGKILTCAEKVGLIYAVDTNGTATAYNLGFGTPEDVRLIPSGRNLYCLDFNNNRVRKVTPDNFAGFVGDVLVLDEGEGCAQGGLYVVHWTGSGFAVRQIPLGRKFEHVQFAPINIQALP